jgi:hypothetical protein
LKRIDLAQGGLTDQKVGIPYITSTARNPAVPNQPPDYEFPTYTITPSPQAKSFHWYAIPRSGKYASDYHGMHAFRTADGRNAYEMGTGISQKFVIGNVDVYTIVCEEFNDKGSRLGTTGRYLQVVQSLKDAETLAAWDKYVALTETQMAKIKKDGAVMARAIYLNLETGNTMELGIFIGTDASDEKTVRLMDLTPGVSRSEYTGGSLDAALADFDSGNSYPKGTIKLVVPPNKSGVSEVNRTFQTTGSSTYAAWSKGTGWAALGFAALAGLLTLTGVGVAFVPVLLLAAAATGATSAGLSLHERLHESEIDPVGVAIDVVSLASSIIGGASAFRAIRQGATVALATRTGRYLLYAGFVTNTVAGVLITVEAVEAIIQINDDPKLSESQKMTAIVRLLAMIGLQAALIGLSVKELGAVRTRIQGVVGQAAAAKLSVEAVYALNMLDERALKAVSTLSAEELERLAQTVRSDPELAAQLLRTGKFQTAATLERGMVADRVRTAVAAWKPGQPIPSAADAIIDDDKFVKYAMDPSVDTRPGVDPGSKGKWKGFEQVGYGVHDEAGRAKSAADVIGQVRQQLPKLPATPGKTATYGAKFVVDVIVTGPNGKAMTLQTIWQFDQDAVGPRLITPIPKVHK